ncbi:serine/threonine-protein phosphatase 6 regulatory subunit 3 [Pelomyxa schiedti]|nr:serine/threonine-protein phosphatase 6 regulatory subunit 3 [Pelomyxa schiedti]
MFWDTIETAPVPPLIDLLQKSRDGTLAEPVTLEKLVEFDDFLQEAKAQNPLIMTILNTPEMVQKIVDHAIANCTPDLSQTKCSYLCTEILCADIKPLLETMFAHCEILNHLYHSFLLDTTTPDPTQSGEGSCVLPMPDVRAAKSAKAILQSCPNQTINFLRNTYGGVFVEQLCNHISTPGASNYLLLLITFDNTVGGAGILQWLLDNCLCEHLIQQLSHLKPEQEQEDSSQVIIDIMTSTSKNRLPDSPISPFVEKLFSMATVSGLINAITSPVDPSNYSSLVNGGPVLIELLQKVPFHPCDNESPPQHMLLKEMIPYLQTVLQATTGGGVGIVRLQVCRLIGALAAIHSPVIIEALSQSPITLKLIDLFFEYPWNSFLHQAVQGIIEHIFTEPLASSLKRQIIVEGGILRKILEAEKLNASEMNENKPCRDYIAHITRIANVISSDSELTSGDTEWTTYTKTILAERTKKEQGYLGGVKPTADKNNPGNSIPDIDMNFETKKPKILPPNALSLIPSNPVFAATDDGKPQWFQFNSAAPSELPEKNVEVVTQPLTPNDQPSVLLTTPQSLGITPNKLQETLPTGETTSSDADNFAFFNTSWDWNPVEAPNGSEQTNLETHSDKPESTTTEIPPSSNIVELPAVFNTVDDIWNQSSNFFPQSEEPPSIPTKLPSSNENTFASFDSPNKTEVGKESGTVSTPSDNFFANFNAFGEDTFQNNPTFPPSSSEAENAFPDSIGKDKPPVILNENPVTNDTPTAPQEKLENLASTDTLISPSVEKETSTNSAETQESRQAPMPTDDLLKTRVVFISGAFSTPSASSTVNVVTPTEKPNVMEPPEPIKTKEESSEEHTSDTQTTAQAPTQADWFAHFDSVDFSSGNAETTSASSDFFPADFSSSFPSHMTGDSSSGFSTEAFSSPLNPTNLSVSSPMNKEETDSYHGDSNAGEPKNSLEPNATKTTEANFFETPNLALNLESPALLSNPIPSPPPSFEVPAPPPSIQLAPMEKETPVTAPPESAGSSEFSSSSDFFADKSNKPENSFPADLTDKKTEGVADSKPISFEGFTFEEPKADQSASTTSSATKEEIKETASDFGWAEFDSKSGSVSDSDFQWQDNADNTDNADNDEAQWANFTVSTPAVPPATTIPEHSVGSDLISEQDPTSVAKHVETMVTNLPATEPQQSSLNIYIVVSLKALSHTLETVLRASELDGKKAKYLQCDSCKYTHYAPTPDKSRCILCGHLDRTKMAYAPNTSPNTPSHMFEDTLTHALHLPKLAPAQSSSLAHSGGLDTPPVKMPITPEIPQMLPSPSIPSVSPKLSSPTLTPKAGHSANHVNNEGRSRSPQRTSVVTKGGPQPQSPPQSPPPQPKQGVAATLANLLSSPPNARKGAQVSSPPPKNPSPAIPAPSTQITSPSPAKSRSPTPDIKSKSPGLLPVSATKSHSASAITSPQQIAPTVPTQAHTQHHSHAPAPLPPPPALVPPPTQSAPATTPKIPSTSDPSVSPLHPDNKQAIPTLLPPNASRTIQTVSPTPAVFAPSDSTSLFPSQTALPQTMDKVVDEPPPLAPVAIKPDTVPAPPQEDKKVDFNFDFDAVWTSVESGSSYTSDFDASATSTKNEIHINEARTDVLVTTPSASPNTSTDLNFISNRDGQDASKAQPPLPLAPLPTNTTPDSLPTSSSTFLTLLGAEGQSNSVFSFSSKETSVPVGIPSNFSFSTNIKLDAAKLETEPNKGPTLGSNKSDTSFLDSLVLQDSTKRASDSQAGKSGIDLFGETLMAPKEAPKQKPLDLDFVSPTFTSKSKETPQQKPTEGISFDFVSAADTPSSSADFGFFEAAPKPNASTTKIDMDFFPSDTKFFGNEKQEAPKPIDATSSLFGDKPTQSPQPTTDSPIASPISTITPPSPMAPFPSLLSVPPPPPLQLPTPETEKQAASLPMKNLVAATPPSVTAPPVSLTTSPVSLTLPPAPLQAAPAVSLPAPPVSQDTTKSDWTSFLPTLTLKPTASSFESLLSKSSTGGNSSTPQQQSKPKASVAPTPVLLTEEALLAGIPDLSFIISPSLVLPNP